MGCRHWTDCTHRTARQRHRSRRRVGVPAAPENQLKLSDLCCRARRKQSRRGEMTGAYLRMADPPIRVVSEQSEEDIERKRTSDEVGSHYARWPPEQVEEWRKLAAQV